jgi:diaminobutyrate-2-oxoglutarate transaminase
VLALGHNHPTVVEAVQRQLETLVHALDFSIPVRDELVSEILDLMPASLRGRVRTQRCAPTGDSSTTVVIAARASGRGV